ncbi:MAG: hypothetical protein SGBAC_000558 [Bacillariaceae sp.]
MKTRDSLTIVQLFQVFLLSTRCFVIVGAFSQVSDDIHRSARTSKRIRRRRRWNPSRELSSRQYATTLDPQGRATSINEEPHPIGLYVHIPYCRRRCRYCNFSIVPIGNRVSTEPSSTARDPDSNERAAQGFEAMNAQYEEALLTELHRLVGQSKKNGSWKIPLQSIYFGGGTPSLAPVETISKILEAAIGENGPFYLVNDDDQTTTTTTTTEDETSSNAAEVSIEMDPGTFTLEQLQMLKDLGFNRISLGVQSFDDTILEHMGRFHRSSDVMDAVDMIDQVFGEDANYSIDLITGVPGLTLAKWAETLQIATTKLLPQPSHMSVYDLQIERGTVFSSWYDQEQDVGTSSRSTSFNRTLPLPTEDECAFMYKYTAGYLRSKQYEHYEVSSYAYKGTNDNSEKGNRSKHNQIYWAPSSSWYAIGVGATSFVEGRLVARPKTLADYYEWLHDNVASEDSNNREEKEEVLSDDELLTELVLKRLRTIDGLDLMAVEDRFGKESAGTILEGAKLGLEIGLAEYDSQTRILRLKEPEGLLFSNSIISSIFAAL